jgi:plasmid stabilization system protein ParE
MKIIVSKDAARYLRHERAYLARFDRRAAETAMRQVQAAIRLLATYPNAGTETSALAGRRRFVTGPYIIDYRVTETTVMIAAIHHGRQQEPEVELDGDSDFEAETDDA